MKTNTLSTEAADWLIRLEDTERPIGARQQNEFFAWLQRSPEHVKAFFETADLWRGLEGFDARRELDLEKFLAGGAARIAALRQDAKPPGQTNKDATRSGQQRRWLLAAAAAISVTAVLAGWQLLFQSNTYSTARGEQRILKLDDGSVLHLNTQSRVRLAFSAGERRVELLAGEALFSVERDARRPFVVRTSTATIRVLGTRFNVQQRDDATTVAVTEGAVQVSHGTSAATRLDAGEKARVTPARIDKQRPRDIAAATAWRERRLVFDNVSLDEVIAEFNRYSEVEIHTEDGVGHSKRLTGIFSADHPQSLLLYLQKEPGLTVEQHGKTFLVNRRAPAN